MDERADKRMAQNSTRRFHRHSTESASPPERKQFLRLFLRAEKEPLNYADCAEFCPFIIITTPVERTERPFVCFQLQNALRSVFLKEEKKKTGHGMLYGISSGETSDQLKS